MLLLMPAKYQPDYVYIRHVKTFRIHIFTGIQIVCSVVMWVIKSLSYTSIIFPLMVSLIHDRHHHVSCLSVFIIQLTLEHMCRRKRTSYNGLAYLYQPSYDCTMYNIIPLLLYGADVWSLTVASQRRLDAFDQCILTQSMPVMQRSEQELGATSYHSHQTETS